MGWVGNGQRGRHRVVSGYGSGVRVAAEIFPFWFARAELERRLEEDVAPRRGNKAGPGANLLARFQGLNLPRWISYPAIQVVTQGLVHGLGLRSARSAGFNTAAACVFLFLLSNRTYPRPPIISQRAPRTGHLARWPNPRRAGLDWPSCVWTSSAIFRHVFIDFFYDFPVLVWPSAASYGVADNQIPYDWLGQVSYWNPRRTHMYVPTLLEKRTFVRGR